MTQRWRDHAARIATNWRAVVAPEDLVLIPGDFSHARTHRDLQPDLIWLDQLPGTKILAPGNHDLWWNRVDAVRRLLRNSQRAVEGDALCHDGLVLAGARSAPVPESDDSGEAVRTMFARAVVQLDRALADAARLRDRDQPLYVLWHYCPFDVHGRPSEVTRRLEDARVSVCVYGHLHTQAQWMRAPQGRIGSVRYACVAADALGFYPLRIERDDLV
jgi:predicted phosphohydrolase